MKGLFSFYFLFILNQALSQEIFACKVNGEIYNVDFQKCTSTLLCDAQNKAVSFDIAYHPNGKLYIISDSGRLNEVNTLNGAITRIHDFSGQTYTSLVTDANGKFYATGRSGLLFTYDIQNDIEVYLGNIGYSAAGDLTFYNGNLYMAAMKNKLVQIDINNPANSFVIMDINTSHSVFGIFSYGNKCEEIDPYLVAQNEIYKIDFIKKSLTFICKLDFDVAGGASTYEFYGSNPIEIQSISVKNPICTNDNGSININSNGGIGKLQYSIDGNQFSDKNEFLGLPSGKYTIYVKDQNGCYISESIELVLEKNIQINVLGQTNASCDHNNGTLSVSASGGSGILRYSLDDQNYKSIGNFDSLSSGMYTIFVKDEVGCLASIKLTIEQTGAPKISSLAINDEMDQFSFLESVEMVLFNIH